MRKGTQKTNLKACANQITRMIHRQQFRKCVSWLLALLSTILFLFPLNKPNEMNYRQIKKASKNGGFFYLRRHTYPPNLPFNMASLAAKSPSGSFSRFFFLPLAGFPFPLSANGSDFILRPILFRFRSTSTTVTSTF